MLSNIILFFVYLVCLAAASRVQYEPYSLIQSDKIVGLWPLDNYDLPNLAPHFDANKSGYYIA